MTAEDAIKLLQKVDPKSIVFIQQGDDAYPMDIRIFQEGHGRKNRTAYACLGKDTECNRRNFPEGYAGTRELKQL